MPKAGRVNTGSGMARSGSSSTPSRSAAGTIAAHSSPIVKGWKVRGVRVGPVKASPNTSILASIEKRPRGTKGSRVSVGIAARRIEASISVRHTKSQAGEGTHWAGGQKRDSHGRFA